jgi:serine/threonine protein kinase
MSERKNIKLIQLIDKETGKTEPYIMELNLVGKGYYGSVYKAVHQHNPNMVFAVKVINLQREETREEILRELEIIQNIPKSPNLVDTHKQHLESARHLYIFQEYCEGGSLAEYKERTNGRLMREE